MAGGMRIRDIGAAACNGMARNGMAASNKAKIAAKINETYQWRQHQNIKHQRISDNGSAISSIIGMA